MFDTVLIANRGEIACRAIATLRRMGLRSLAVYSAADAQSLHVQQADIAVHIGGPFARESYLDASKLLDVARAHGAGAVFPGYGFLSENADFAERCEEQGIVFIGPRPEHLRDFGLKHRARALAHGAGVPLLAGSDLLESAEDARREARRIGYPVMLKNTAGGGGIGLLMCSDEAELGVNFATARRLGESHFASGGVFLERQVRRARHVEVQIFGDGKGHVAALGLRDCSAQRRNQKVIEETASNLPQAAREGMQRVAVELGRSCQYLSAGTVEFVYDVEREDYYFLEVNTRLQVEHGVTELVTGIDLVEWMVATAQHEPPELNGFKACIQGHAIEARVYAEAPAMGFRPSSGLLTEVRFPDARSGLRIDTWVETGVEVSAHYDPLLAKVMSHGKSREAAIASLRAALADTEIAGVQTNLEYLSSILDSEAFTSSSMTTQELERTPAIASGIEVIDGGTLSTVQDHPGRLGFWHVGIPPSGAMDSLALRLGNRVLGNVEGAAGLEMTLRGMTLRFHQAACIAIAGADMQPKLDGEPVERYTPIFVERDQRLELGNVSGPGARLYLCVRGGFSVPEHLGSRSTFMLGRFGGYAGRALQSGDVLQVAESDALDEPEPLPVQLQPELTREWQLGVVCGPQGAPDFFTERDIETFFATAWEVHYNSARTGVRLIGPKPEWARPDGGEAGLHPSNIHDNAYAFGAVDFTGDMPILLGPDGPSLGGFVCPATVIQSERWKLGQLAPGDRVRFVPVTPEQAAERRRALDATVRDGKAPPSTLVATPTEPVIGRNQHDATPTVTYRAAGDDFVLVEYGEMVLDLRLRFRVHALMGWLEAQLLPGLIDLTPGIRSLLVHYDAEKLPRQTVLGVLERGEKELPETTAMRVPTRVLHLPLSWDDEATQLAIRKYTRLVRKDAPWAPSNIEFIRRINGLADEQAVKDIVFGASYLVLGLGDVYLGAPVATPVDPRHRLVTTKYNPARTWTPESAVGIGGAYLCIYGMEGPGGYQFVGRTLQVYNRFRVTRDFEAGKPWLLRFFDQIRFHPVSGKELRELRDAFAAGRHSLDVREETFDLGEYDRFLERNDDSIAEFKSRQQAAFDAERKRWVERGLLHFSADHDAAPMVSDQIPNGHEAARSPVPGSVWKVEVAQGDRVTRDQTLLVLESMKMEISVKAPCAGTVSELRTGEGQSVQAGQVLVVVSE